MTSGVTNEYVLACNFNNHIFCCIIDKLNVYIFFSLNYRIPEGPIDQGPASGRVRALEEQLVKAKEQIENYKKQTRNGMWYYSVFPLQYVAISTNN